MKIVTKNNSLINIFLSHVQSNPDAPAVHYPEKSAAALSYIELDSVFLFPN